MLEIYITDKRSPMRAIIYGGGGVGKTTFASQCPSPVFIATEDGAQGMSVTSFKPTQLWSDIIANLTALAKENHEYKTVVVDALDGVERAIWNDVAKAEGVATLQKIPYGRGFDLALDHWQRLLAGLTHLRDKRGMRAVLIAHAHTRKLVSPDLPDFDRYEPRLHAKALGILSEWADIVGFARVQTLTREDDGGRVKGISTGNRMLCCNDSAAWLAKNRYGITEPIALTWTALASATKETA